MDDLDAVRCLLAGTCTWSPLSFPFPSPLLYPPPSPSISCLAFPCSWVKSGAAVHEGRLNNSDGILVCLDCGAAQLRAKKENFERCALKEKSGKREVA